MRRTICLLTLVAVLASCTSSTDPTTTSSGDVTSTVAGSSTTSGEQTSGTADRLDELGGEPCPDSDFTCITLEVPLDHFGSNGETTEVVFAVLPATGEREGVFVTATGGPGTAGISYADSYTSALDEEFTENFDIVFFDQRGTGLSGGLTCPQAVIPFYRTEATNALGFDQDGFTAAAETFVTDCLKEAGDSPLWPYVSTAQMVEDIEIFRETMGYDSLIIYGESYGTQVAQTYAAAHPDRVERMVIDGVVDLTLTGLEFFVDQANAFVGTLEATFDGCLEDPLCAEDFDGSDPRSEYDRLVALLLEEPLTAEFPLPDGTTATRSLGHGDFEVAASGQMYGEIDRAMFLRALAASAARDDMVPMLRLFYPALGLDPIDESVIEDPSWSDAMYFGVDCLDYHYPGDTPEERAQAFFDNAVGFEIQRLGSAAIAELPCAFWPYTASDPARPEPLVGEGIPTLVLGATADPATPYGQGVNVHARLADGHAITQDGGPHVIYGRGNDCPDIAVTAFLLDGETPTVTSCDGWVVGYYPPLFPLSVAEFDDAETLLSAIEDEVFFLPEYWYWDGYSETAAGCHEGGTLDMGPTDTGYYFEFESCAFAEDGPITGRAEYDWEEDIFTMEDISIGADDCRFSYVRSGDGYDVSDDCEALFGD